MATPYWPMVKAIAPNAPSGAAYIRMWTIRKTIAVSVFSEVEHGLAARAGQREGDAEQDRDQQHLEDLAFGEGADQGVRDDVEEEAGDALLVRLADVSRRPAWLSSVAGSTLRPAPGWTRLATTRPIASASVETVRK